MSVAWRCVLVGTLLMGALGPGWNQGAWAASPHCTLEGVFGGYAPVERVAGVPFVALTFDAATTDCGPVDALLPVSPDPYGVPLVGDTPRLEVGARYAVSLRPLGQRARARWGTHALAAAHRAEGGATGGLRVPQMSLSVRKAGNNVPPCTRGRWRSSSLPVALELHSAGSDDIAQGSDLEAIERAALMWSTPACSMAALDVSARYAEPATLEADGRNTVQWIEDDPDLFASVGAENIGFTCYVCDDEGYYIEADVRLNGTERRWSTGCEGDAFDVEGALLHELGHVLGASHAEDTGAVMYPATSARRLLSTRQLGAADILDMCARYPCASDECEAPIAEELGCPAGQGLCAPCASDEACGASGDACLSDAETGARVCARACSASFPCPEGYACASVGAASLQCVPVSGFCEDLDAYVGCACGEDGECSGPGGRCLDGRCAVACEGGVACPTGSECVRLYAESGLPEGRWCVAAETKPAPCGHADVRGLGCAIGGSPWATLTLAVAALFVRRRRI